MAVTRNYGNGSIVNAIIVKRRDNTPNDIFVLTNIIRMITSNQTAQLALQTTLDGWATPLVAIPTNRFHVGSNFDFNDLACNIVSTITPKNEDGIYSETLDISIICSVEQHITPTDLYARCKSYITAYKEILKTFCAYAEPEFKYNYLVADPLMPKSSDFLDIGIENPIITGVGLTPTATLPNISSIRKALGFLPTLSLQVTINPSTY